MAKSLADLALESETGPGRKKSLADLALEGNSLPVRKKSLADFALETEAPPPPAPEPAPDNLQSTFDKYKEIVGQEAIDDLQSKWNSIVKTSKRISHYPKIDRSSKESIQKSLRGLRDPIAPFRPQQDRTQKALWQEMTGYEQPTGEQAEAMRTELKVAERNEPTPEELAKEQIELERNPAASTLQLIAEKLAPISSVPAEVVDTLRRQAQWAVGGGVGDVPSVRWAQAFETGSREGSQVPSGFGDTFVNSFKEIMQRDPSKYENALLQGIGLASEWVGPLDALKVLRPLRSVPGMQTFAQRMETALQKGGLTEFSWQSYPERKIAQAIRDAEEARSLTTHMGGNLPGAIAGPLEQDIAAQVAKTIPQQTPPQMVKSAMEEVSQQAAFPDRIQVARDKLREITEAWGGNADAVERAFLRDIGPEGINAETAWAKWMPEAKMNQAEVEAAMAKTRDLPVGAAPQPGIGKVLAPLARIFTHEGGVAKGVGQIARQNQGRAMAARNEAEKAAVEIEGALGPERSVDLARWMDARQRKAQLSKWVTETDTDLGRLSRNYAVHANNLDSALAKGDVQAAATAWDDLRIDLDEYSKGWDDDAFTAGLKQTIKSLWVQKNELEQLASKGADLTLPMERFKAISDKARSQFDALVVAEKTHLDNTKALYDRISKELDDKIAGALKPKNAEEQRAVDFVRDSFDEMHDEAQQWLGSNGYVDEYISRIEKQESKGQHLEVYGKKTGQGGRLFFQRKRLPSTAEVSLDWDRTRKFHQNLGDIYQQRAKAHHLAIANAKAEDEILKSYSGTPTFLTQAEEVEKAKTGLVKYIRRYGPNKGESYWVDKGTAMFMDRALTAKRNPEGQLGKFMDVWDQVHGWLKGRMTILRPGFVVRNFLGGNIYNMWLADVELMPNLNDAAKILAFRSKQKALELTPRSTLGRLARDISQEASDEAIGLLAGELNNGFKVPSKISGRTPQEWLKLAEDAKIFGTGQIGGELASEIGTATRGSNLQLINPLSNKNIWAKSVSGANKFVEDLSKLAMFTDRIKKGFSPAEAAADVAKYLFNYDELSHFNRAAGKVISFPTWQFKNFGLQLSSLMMKPDKVAKYLRARTAIQDLDPLSPEEQRLADVMPDQLKGQEPFMLPFMRGEKGERQYFIEGGLTPLASLNLISAEKIANKQAGDWPEAVSQTLIGMLAPPIKGAIKFLGGQSEQMERGFWMGRANYDTAQYVWAPSYVASVMTYVREKHPKMYEELVQSEAIVPIQENGSIVGYKWPRSRQDALEAMDPGLGILRRIFPQFGGDAAYRGREAFWSGMKSTDLTEDRAVNWQRADFDRRLKELQEREKTMQSLGLSPKAKPYKVLKGAGK